MRRATTLLGHVLDARREQECLDVPVTETVDMVLATQHGRRYEPAGLLVDRARDGRKFFEEASET